MSKKIAGFMPIAEGCELAAVYSALTKERLHA